MTSTRTRALRRARSAALTVAAVFALSSAAAPAAHAEDRSNVGLWISCGFIDLLYTPIKATFFVTMGVGGGLSAMVTVPMDRTEVSTRIIEWGYYGDWLVRPDHFSRGAWPNFIGFEKEIRFLSGPDDTETGLSPA